MKWLKNGFNGLVVFLLTSVIMPLAAFAADGAADNENSVKMYLALGAGFAIAVAALGGALGQGKAAAAALEGIARNPGAQGKIMAPMILALALIESLVIYALIIAFSLAGKI
jgi:F-type H+-transporting ATPase subunit c